MLSKWVITNLYINGVCWGYNPLILTFDPSTSVPGHPVVVMFGMQPPGDGHGQLAKLSDDLQQVESPGFFLGGAGDTT